MGQMREGEEEDEERNCMVMLSDINTFMKIKTDMENRLAKIQAEMEKLQRGILEEINKIRPRIWYAIYCNDELQIRWKVAIYTSERKAKDSLPKEQNLVFGTKTYSFYVDTLEDADFDLNFSHTLNGKFNYKLSPKFDNQTGWILFNRVN